MAKEQIKDELVEKLMEDLKTFDFSYFLSSDLEIWKQGVNKEYLIKKQLDLVVKKYGIENVSKLEKAVLKIVPKVYVRDLEEYVIMLWFIPYYLQKSNIKTDDVSLRLQSHQSIKNNPNDRS